MKKNQERALNAFAALESLPDGMLLEAEQALMAAEGGVIAPVKKPKPKGGFARFMRSGWSVAAMVSVVALAALVFVIRGGHTAPVTYESPKMPVGGCTIEMSDRGVNFTIATEVENYPDGVGCITVVMTGRDKGKVISNVGGWHLERLTPDGAVVEEISYTTEVTVSAKPGRNEYATVKQTLYGTYTGGGFPAGTYRLHATKFDGEKYVSVAYCTFTIGSPEGETRPTLDYHPAEEQLYTVSVPDTIEYGAAMLPITATSTRQNGMLVFYREFSIIKLAGPENGEDATWMHVVSGNFSPSEKVNGYEVEEASVAFRSPEDWLPGLYRLYALNFDGEYVDYCDFVITGDHGRSFEMFLNETAITTLHTALSAKIIPHEKGVSFGGGNQWALYRVEGEERTRIGSRSTEEAFEPPEVAPDEFCVVSRFAGIMDLTGDKNLPAGQYELVYDPNGHAVVLPFTVVEDPDKQLLSGTFLWVNGEPMLWDGGEYLPIRLLPATESVSFDGLTTGYYVEVIAGYVLETAPPTTQVHRIISRNGYMSNPDLPAYTEWLAEMGYTVTNYPVKT